MRKIVASVSFFILSSVVSFAADMPVKAKVAPAVLPFNWTGWYAGIDGGGMWGTTSNDQNFPNVSTSSGFFGIQGGYRYQLPNNIVLGLQATVPLWISQQNKTIAAGIINTAKSKGAFLGQGQVGYAFDRWLISGTAGIGAIRIEGQEIAGAIVSNVVTNTHTLLTAGAGIDYAITDHITTGVHYNHIWSSHELYDCGPASCAPPANIWFNADTVAAVLEYKF